MIETNYRLWQFHIPDSFFSMQFFTHPVVHDEMNRKWHDRCKFMNRTEEEANEKLIKKSEWKSWALLLLLHLLCVFDLAFSPILLLVFSIIKETRCRQGVDETGTTQYLTFLF